MANQEHANIARQGAPVIQQWRKQNPGQTLDLDGADLTETYLNGSNFFNTNISHADLSHADLTDANFHGASLNRTCLCGTNLAGTTLTRCLLFQANLSQANLTRAYLAGADLTGAILTPTSMDLYAAKSLVPFRTINRRTRDLIVAALDTITVDD